MLIREIGLYSRNTLLKDIYPLERILLPVASLIGCNFFKTKLGVILNIVFFLILNKSFKNPKSIVLKFLKMSLLFGLFMTLGNLLNGINREDLVLSFLKIINGGVTISFLALTVSINDIVNSLGKYTWFRDIGDIIKTMEQFLIIVEEDFFKIKKAMLCRAGFKSVKDFGVALGLTFKNLIYRFKNLKLGLKNRCYKGRMYYRQDFKRCKALIILDVSYIALVVIGVIL